MTPVDPETQAAGWEPKVYAKRQPQYLALPCLARRDRQGAILTRWRPTAEELAKLLDGEDLFLEVWTFHNALQPVRLGVWSDHAVAAGEAKE